MTGTKTQPKLHCISSPHAPTGDMKVKRDREENALLPTQGAYRKEGK